MNWKQMTIGKKINGGFGVVLSLLIAVVVLSYTIVGDVGDVVKGSQLDGELAQKEVDHLNWVKKVDTLLTDDTVTQLDVQTDDRKCAFGKWLYGEGRNNAERMVPELASLLKAVEQPHRDLHESAVEIGKVFKQPHMGLSLTLSNRLTDHFSWVAQLAKSLAIKAGGSDANQAQSKRADEFSTGVQLDPTKCAFGKFLADPKTRELAASFPALQNTLDAIKEPHERLHETAVNIEDKVNQSDISAAIQIFNQDTQKALDDVKVHFFAAIAAEQELQEGMDAANRVYSKKTAPALRQVQGLINTIRSEAAKHLMTNEEMLAAATASRRNITLIGIVAVLSGVFIAFFLTKGITNVLKRTSSQIEEGASQIYSATSQVSSASQSLAEGASEQAASIEETSSSLEEISAMTQQNANNAKHANGLMAETIQVVEQANASMGELTRSMAEISTASGETSKIIKTIDEIAFQTNLLALNAAVEAARAGEAGAGFAVVADEVRNLALRAAEAAKNTAVLIEGTVKKVNAGSTTVMQTNEAFAQVADSSRKVGDLVSEIATASNEQAQGIEQVNTAVSEMGQVTQQNAASAEESASASEEMSAQAEQMKAMVGELVVLVDGHKKRHRTPSIDQPREARLSVATSSPVTAVSRRKVLPAEDRVIPMDGDKIYSDF